MTLTRSELFIEALVLIGVFVLFFGLWLTVVRAGNRVERTVATKTAENRFHLDYLTTSMNRIMASYETAWEADERAMCFSDVDGRVVEANEAYLHLWGMTIEEAKSDDWMIKLTASSRDRAIARLEAVLASHDRFMFDDLELNDGTQRLVKIIATPILDNTDKFVGYASVLMVIGHWS